ncbi:MAG: hypothetical protein HYX27_00985 [Acidobacteria bacterium]|nr:hypothetical protein [Acidobacteriota bacterium]
MKVASSSVRQWTRRAVLGAAAGSAVYAARGQDGPGEAKKFLDPATEFEVLRVSGVEHNAWLPIASNRAFTRHGDALLFASDASGKPQLYRHDFRGNKLRQLTEAEKLNTNTFTWIGSDRLLMYFDGRKLLQSGSGRERLIYELPDTWAESPRMTASEDGQVIVVSAYNGTKTKIMLAGRAGATAEEREGDIGTLCLRPKRAAVSYVAGGQLRLLTLDTKKAATLQTAPGEVLSAYWTADGGSILYLLKPAATGKLTEIREIVPDGNKDSPVTKTSQYVHFQRNSDASVFLGASASVASPHLLLLLRSVKRELTICEHRCSDARLSRAVFSPNSSRVAFLTDRHKNLVIYSMAVDRLIEETEENT